MPAKPDLAAGDRNTIRVESMVAFRDKQPYVKLRWGDLTAQLTPNEARAHAMIILEAADAAVNDAFLIYFFEQKLHQESATAAAILSEYRAYRESGVRP